MRVFLSITLLTMLLIGCSNANPSVTKSTKDSIANEAVSNTPERAEFNVGDDLTLDDLLPDPPWHDSKLYVFTRCGIESFYRLYKRVPDSFDEYIGSGIPMIIPRDYLTGKPYKLVETIDMSDSAGFTFKTDGNKNCRFDFVIVNDKTNERDLRTFDFGESYWEPYDAGLFSKNNYNFDWVKREYCLMMVIHLAVAYMEEFGEAPDSLHAMFAGEGELIEEGWKWIPVNKGKSTDYFEFGVDSEKARFYHKNGCTGECKPLSIIIYQLYAEDVPGGREDVEGLNKWRYTSDDVIPPEICNMKKFLSSDSFYEGYLEIVQS